MIVIHYSLFTIHYSLFTIHYSLFTAPPFPNCMGLMRIKPLHYLAPLVRAWAAMSASITFLYSSSEPSKP
ncbi:MAG TPA: hypothetical protein DCF68_06840 [Cyanothece sp. UBA12306]|nr:hypothetical protein [Cyanothece sp. UBA12306]